MDRPRAGRLLIVGSVLVLRAAAQGAGPKEANVRRGRVAVEAPAKARKAAPVAGSGPGGNAMSDAELDHGFRCDPMKWADSADTLAGAWVRTVLLKTPKEGDGAILRRERDRLFAMQTEDGHIGENTVGALMRLLDLGCPPGGGGGVPESLEGDARQGGRGAWRPTAAAPRS